jgi:hypothetical protein
MTQVVECLLNKRKALNSSLSTEGKKRKKKEKEYSSQPPSKMSRNMRPSMMSGQKALNGTLEKIL